MKLFYFLKAPPSPSGGGALQEIKSLIKKFTPLGGQAPSGVRPGGGTVRRGCKPQIPLNPGTREILIKLF